MFPKTPRWFACTLDFEKHGCRPVVLRLGYTLESPGKVKNSLRPSGPTQDYLDEELAPAGPCRWVFYAEWSALYRSTLLLWRVLSELMCGSGAGPEMEEGKQGDFPSSRAKLVQCFHPHMSELFFKVGKWFQFYLRHYDPGLIGTLTLRSVVSNLFEEDHWAAPCQGTRRK